MIKKGKIGFFHKKKRISTPKEANVLQITYLEVYPSFGGSGGSKDPLGHSKKSQKTALIAKNQNFWIIFFFSFKKFLLAHILMVS